ncbi:unnamed protein product, partial [Symbiodinium sp. KB8]
MTGDYKCPPGNMASILELAIPGKAVPASSAKALEICGDTSKLGVSPADVFAQFGRPLSKADDATVSLEDVEDNEPRVREGMQKRAAQAFGLKVRVKMGLSVRCLQVLVENLQRDFAKHLRSELQPSALEADASKAMFAGAPGPLLIRRMAIFFHGTGNLELLDPWQSPPSNRSWLAICSEQKSCRSRQVFRHCQKDCLELLTSNLRHVPQPSFQCKQDDSIPNRNSSLHDELGLPPGGQDRYARVLAASLSALGELVPHIWAACAAPPEDATLAGAVPLQDGDPNSHRGDVRATLHAFSVAIQRRARHAVIASDSQAAIDVCFDRAKHARDDHLAAAEVSALIDWLKVASHTGCSFNEAADGVAKTANVSDAGPDFSFRSEALSDSIQEGVIHLLWQRSRSPGVDLQLPLRRDNGEWTPGQVRAEDIAQTLRLKMQMSMRDQENAAIKMQISIKSQELRCIVKTSARADHAQT